MNGGGIARIGALSRSALHEGACCGAFTPDVHAISRPAGTFTGDFYFVDRDARDRLWFALGDVAGKGIGAAVYMAMIDEHLEELVSGLAAEMTPIDVVRSLEAVLRPHFPSNRFATAVVGVCSGGALEIVNAGHCEPVLVTRDGALSISSHGPVIGIHPVPRWGSARYELERGDLLVAYSDGILEARNRDEIEFGSCRIVRSVAASRGQSARDAASRLLEDVVRFRSGQQEDDVTVMAVRW